MNCATVDYLENEIREREATIEGLAQERTELEDALGRLINAIEWAVIDLGTAEAPLSIRGVRDRLMAALEDEGCGSTE